VKAKWNEDLRRLTISKEITYESLRNILSKLFQLDIQVIKYFDDENDQVRITSDEELDEAVRLTLVKSQPHILRVEVTGVPATIPLVPFSTPKPEERSAPSSIVQINSDNGEEMMIISDSKGNTQVSLLKEQVTLGISPSTPNSNSVLTLSQTITVPHNPEPTTLINLKDGKMGIAQIAENTAEVIRQLAKNTMNRTYSIASDAATLGNQDIIEMCSSTMELSKASAERVSELSKSIAEATNKAAVGAAMLGEELRKATMENMADLSNKTRDKTSELSKATSERLDEVLRAFKQQMQNAH